MKKTSAQSPESKQKPGFDNLRKISQGAQHLVIFRGILGDPTVCDLLDLLDAVTGESKASKKVARKIAQSYASFFSGLATKAERRQEPGFGNPWQNHLIDLILNDENPFTRKAEQPELGDFGDSLIQQVEMDLSRLQGLYFIESDQVLAALRKVSPEAEWLSWNQLDSSKSSPSPDRISLPLRQAFHQAVHWDSLLPSLIRFYSQAGVGILARYNALHWKRTPQGGCIQEIPHPDPIRLEDLVGCDEQKEWLVRNTLFFISEQPANNIFVYGDRGTGKSSAIKALLHHFAGQPLRMLEISRDDLGDLPEVMKLLRPRREYFIIFIDDLSFEEGETQYKTLKAVLEGSLEARPRNVLIYATSNRRHLIKEYFSDRDSFRSDEVRHQDTLQEKVSLADRFGIQLVFVAPDQNLYLEIVHSMARRRELDISEEELNRRALQWAQFHNARSGRTARQFIDFLTGELNTKPNGAVSSDR